eukprot:scaffold368_cov258-Pinguiococcus_pyrenoidosus.AAC.54
MESSQRKRRLLLALALALVLVLALAFQSSQHAYPFHHVGLDLLQGVPGRSQLHHPEECGSARQCSWTHQLQRRICYVLFIVQLALRDLLSDLLAKQTAGLEGCIAVPPLWFKVGGSVFWAAGIVFRALLLRATESRALLRLPSAFVGRQRARVRLQQQLLRQRLSTSALVDLRQARLLPLGGHGHDVRWPIRLDAHRNVVDLGADRLLGLPPVHKINGREGVPPLPLADARSLDPVRALAIDLATSRVLLRRVRPGRNELRPHFLLARSSTRAQLPVQQASFAFSRAPRTSKELLRVRHAGYSISGLYLLP